MDRDVEPLFLGGDPALDFLNTRFTPPGAVVEVIADGPAFLGWLVQAGLLPASHAAKMKRGSDVQSLDALAAEARKLRTWARAWIERWTAAPGDAYTSELRRLNALLAGGSSYYELVEGETGLQLVQRAHLDSSSAVIALLAASLARLVSSESPELVKRCAGAGCSLWFLDRTKAHRRLFCSAAACGNRAKVAAFRERANARAPRS